MIPDGWIGRSLLDAPFNMPPNRLDDFETFVEGYLGSSPDPGCEFPASTSQKNTEERSKIILFNEYDKSEW